MINDGEMQEVLLEEVEKEEDSVPEEHKTNLRRFLEFLFYQNSRVTASPRVIAAALYLASGIQNATWLRTVGSSITLVSSVLGVIINQNKAKDVPPNVSGCEYFLEMLKRSFRPIDHIRQFTGPLLFLSSTCLGIGGFMSGRYWEIAFTGTGWVLGAIYMFTPKDVDANLYAYRFRMLVMPLAFVVNGKDALVDSDHIAISSMVLNQISTIFSGSINAWGKMHVEPYEDGKTWLNFMKLCCWSSKPNIKTDDPDALSVSR